MGGLVQQPAAPGAHRQHSAGRSRGALLRHTGKPSYGGVTFNQTASGKPGAVQGGYSLFAFRRGYNGPAAVAVARCGSFRTSPATFTQPDTLPSRRAKDYADFLQSAGVKVRYSCHEHMIHHFYAMAGAIPYAKTALEEAGADIKAALEECKSRDE